MPFAIPVAGRGWGGRAGGLRPRGGAGLAGGPQRTFGHRGALMAALSRGWGLGRGCSLLLATRTGDLEVFPSVDQICLVHILFSSK